VQRGARVRAGGDGLTTSDMSWRIGIYFIRLGRLGCLYGAGRRSWESI
jgi:hypothetical protein